MPKKIDPALEQAEIKRLKASRVPAGAASGCLISMSAMGIGGLLGEASGQAVEYGHFTLDLFEEFWF